MNGTIGVHTFAEIVHEHWLSAFLILVTLTTIGIILILRWYVRRRLRVMLENRFEEEHELDLLPSSGPREQEALAIIARFREEVWQLPESELQIGLEPFNRRAVTIVRAIGAVYHPDAAQPEFEASLTDTLELVKRVSTRLTRLAATVPFKYLGGRKLSDFQRYYQVYLKINDSPVLRMLKKNPHIYKAARFMMNIKNISNPLYWAGKELTREGYFFIMRWFYLSFTSEIGKEAIRLFSGTRFQREEERDAVLVCYRLFHTMRKWSGPSPAEWAAFVGFVANQSTLEPDVKLHILARCSEDRLPKDVEEQKISTKSGIKWYREGLKKMLDADAGPSTAKVKLIEKESNGQMSAG
ncbi:MAG: hypothetical protein WAW37_03640 [Syntrophobacteraceae bacterium]